MLKNRILYSIGLVATVIFVLSSWVWIAVFLFLLVLLLPVLSVLLTIGIKKYIRYDIVVPSKVTRGEEFSIAIHDRSDRLIPDYIVEIDVENCFGEKVSWLAELTLEERRYIKLREEHCGSVICRIRNIYACDYLGLFCFRLRNINDAVVAIMPIESPPEPLPSISQIAHTTYRPKYGGGFSEVHDLREYRPGDSLRDVHWKLTAKTDRLIVREAQEPNRGIILVTIDLMPPSARMDRRFDNLAWVSQWLCSNNLPHEVRWVDPVSRMIRTCQVETPEQSDKMLAEILRERVTKELPSINNISFTGVEWHYHIGGEGEQ